MAEFPRRATAPGVHNAAPDVPARGVPITGLMIATPMAGGGLNDMAYAAALADLRAACVRRDVPVTGVFLRGESDVQQARNRLMASFLASDCSHLLFIDADIGFAPECVFRLIAHDMPLVGATYAKKQLGPTEYAVSVLPRAECLPSGLVEVNGLPGGFLMVQRNAAERLAGAYRHLAYAPRDGVSDAATWRSHLIDLFSHELSADGVRYSEDIAFCRRWRAIGGRVWLDPHILLEHYGIVGFSGHPAEMFTAAPPGDGPG